MSQEVRDNNSQASYSPTPYSDCSWEIVGEFKNSDAFEAEEFSVIRSPDRKIIDPMFANYGGIPKDSHEKRWHLPEGVSERRASTKKQETENEEPVISFTEAEFDKLKSDLIAQAKEESLLEAVQIGDAKFKLMEERVFTILEEMQNSHASELQILQKEALELSVAIAERILGTTVEINPEYILPIINEALKQVGSAKIKKIQVSPADLEFIDVLKIRSHLKQFDGSWEFEADPTLTSGCMIHTTAGEIDYKLDAAFARLKAKLMGDVK